MNVPNREKALQMLKEGEQQNPGSWVQHSHYVAVASEKIAVHHPQLDPEIAFVLGLLHDIGRREGPGDLRHTIAGHRYLTKIGYPEAARICLTHSFSFKDIHAYSGTWDCTREEIQFLEDFLEKVEYNEYDRLIQLCDALSLPSGFCLIEKRLIETGLRHGVNAYSVRKWQATLQLLRDFETAIGGSIYRLLPGVVENTFGFSKTEEG